MREKYFFNLEIVELQKGDHIRLRITRENGWIIYSGYTKLMEKGIGEDILEDWAKLNNKERN
jgi:hypothetical protein